jgi:hypothetical protein
MKAGSVITFYSFKGGTGRTMALANAGVELARKEPGDVLMVDWDLEAPGLHEFFPEVGRFGAGPKRGVLELFETAAEKASGPSDLSPEAASEFWYGVDLGEFIVPTEEDSLFLLPSGRLDRTYGSRVSKLPWRDLFAWGPALFTAFVERLSSHYRYVLIDSRTGVSDTSGICTMLLPDRLVVVFTSNRQSLTGALDQARCATDYRTRSADGRPLLVFPLVSRVEMSEDDLRRSWRYGERGALGYQPEFERLFEDVYGLPQCDLEQYFDEVQIQHAARYAYGERVAVRDESSDRLSLSRSYQRFTRALQAPGGPWQFEASERRRPVDQAAAEHVIDAVERRADSHFRAAIRAKWLNLVLLGVVVAGIAAGLVLLVGFGGGGSSSTFSLRPSFASVIFAGVVELGRRLLGLESTYRRRTEAANDLIREIVFFQSDAGPYGAALDPASLLLERSVQIDAEVALAARGRPWLPRS